MFGTDREKSLLPKEKEAEGLQDRIVKVSRVSKVVKGGRRFSFSALVVVGDRTNKVGFGVGGAGEVPDAIKKASDQAKKSLKSIYKVKGTIPFEVEGRFGSSRVKMYPAQPGKGIIAGGAVRIILELAGVKDIVCKVHGSRNGHNVVRATFDGLDQLFSAQAYADMRGVELSSLQSRATRSRKAVVADQEAEAAQTAAAE
jgi:small subunit ribosomal protein S5